MQRALFNQFSMPRSKRSYSLQQEDFERLLVWLDEDRERAGMAYERVRWRLTAIFASRGCRVPEELADETIDRVSRRVADIRETYVGDRILYFLGVANNIHHEYLRRPALSGSPPANDVREGEEQTHQCLEMCINNLTEKSQHLIRKYYAEDKQAKIDLRRRLADELGLSTNTLRVRALRIREELQSCIQKCLAGKL